ncbi:MAG: RNA pyrophosphohydrolase [Pseudomonadota bacterium]
MLDKDGYRPNVGIVIANGQGQVLWARRIGGHDAWQFPQGGVNEGESLRDALFRELEEEVGLTSAEVRIIAQTSSWLRYRIPRRFRRHNSDPNFKGQKQHWFLLELTGDEASIDLNANPKPEFDGWKWVSFWYPVAQVVDFKRPVYQRALKELAPHLPLPAGERAPSHSAFQQRRAGERRDQRGDRSRSRRGGRGERRRERG